MILIRCFTCGIQESLAWSNVHDDQAICPLCGKASKNWIEEDSSEIPNYWKGDKDENDSVHDKTL